jgi:MoaA/NifB/PqqE/SkfB family radical SAM enzyme
MKTALEVYLFGDGEVLLDVPRHLSMLESIYRENPACGVGFSTNGKLLTPEVYRLYSAAGIGYIQLSIDAATKDLYETMRRGGNFDELVANLEGIAALRRRAKAKQPRLHLATVISKQNYHQLPALAEFAKRYDFCFWYINAEYPHNPGRALLTLARDDLAELERMRAEILQRYGSCYATAFDPSIGLDIETREERFESRAPVFCTVPWQRFELKANGEVKVCPYFHEPIRTMNGSSLVEVWNGHEFRQIRRAFVSRRGIPSYCLNCHNGMRRQYLRGFPVGSDIYRVSPLARLIRGGRAIKQRIFG